ncbi:hypothetical protein [Carboxylicivirga taeanensis]|uniref:hypothetical protein n=1 Tax=Carboxylicivirga taeanensis TaxID=1416875 RepID=UPI003F6E31C5
MKRLRIIALIAIVFISLQCNIQKQNKINGYKIGDRITNDWTLLSSDIERSWKNYKNINDSDLFCQCVADTIWNLTLFNLTDSEKDSLVGVYKQTIGTNYDSIYRPKTIGKFESIELKWHDFKSNDEITLMKVKMNESKDLGSWTLNLRNERILNKLSMTHDPFYKIPIPIEQ